VVGENCFPFRCVQLRECRIVFSPEAQIKLFGITHNEGLGVNFFENNGDVREYQITMIEEAEGMK
jgi:hypothetical protein